MSTILAVLASWVRATNARTREAANFYYRLLTNRLELPRWLWLCMLASLIVAFAILIITGK